MVEKLEFVPELFHSHVRRKGCLSVGPLKSRYGRAVPIVADMSKLLVNAFSAVFVEGAPDIAAQYQSFSGVLDEVYVSPECCYGFVCFEYFFCRWSRWLHPHLLKACSAALSLPFSLLLKKFLDKGVLPNLWKTSTVAPLYKNGSRCAPLNHCAASLTSGCCKVLERDIVCQVVD